MEGYENLIEMEGFGKLLEVVLGGTGDFEIVGFGGLKMVEDEGI